MVNFNIFRHFNALTYRTCNLIQFQCRHTQCKIVSWGKKILFQPSKSGQRFNLFTWNITTCPVMTSVYLHQLQEAFCGCCWTKSAHSHEYTQKWKKRWTDYRRMKLYNSQPQSDKQMESFYRLRIKFQWPINLLYWLQCPKAVVCIGGSSMYSMFDVVHYIKTAHYGSDVFPQRWQRISGTDMLRTVYLNQIS